MNVARLAALALMSCGPMATAPNQVVVTAPSTSAKRAPTPCEIARDLRAQVPALVRQGRIDRVARSSKRADELCPATAAETAAARDAAIAELARGGDPDELFDQAIAARATDAMKAQTLIDRALAELERRSATPAFAEVRRAAEPGSKPQWIDAAHVLVVRTGGAFVVDVATGRAWGPLETGDIVDRIAVDRRGASVAIIAQNFGADRSRFRVWDWKTGRAVGDAIDVVANSVGLETSPDGAVMALERVSNDKHTVALWDWSLNQIRAELAPARLDPPDSAVKTVLFSRDGALLATTWMDGSIAIFDVKTGARVVAERSTEIVESIAFSTGGEWLGWRTSTAFGVIDVRARAAVPAIQRTDCTPSAIGFDPKSRALLSASYDRSVCIFDLATKRVRVVAPREWPPPPPPRRDPRAIRGLAPGMGPEMSPPDQVWMSDDGRFVFMSIGWGATLQFDPRSGHIVPAPATVIGYTGESFVVATRDGAIEVSIDSSGSTMRGVATKTRAEVWSTPWSIDMSATSGLAPDGVRFVAAGTDVVIVDAKTGARTSIPDQGGPPAIAREEMFDATKRSIAFAMDDGSVVRFDAATGALVESRAPVAEGTVPHVAPRIFYTTAQSDTVQVDLSAPPVKLEKSSRDLAVVALSPDATLFAAYQYTSLAPAPRIHGVRIWDVATGKLLRELAGHSNPLRWLVFSPDGRRLATATGGGDPTIRIWDVATGAELQSIDGLADFPASIAFSPDSGRLAASGSKGTIKIFEVATGKVVQTIATPLENLRVSFGADGATVSGLAEKRFVTWSVDGGARVREVDLERAGKRATVVPGRDLLALTGDGDVAMLGLFSGRLVLGFRPIPDGAIAFARDGRVELIGDRGDHAKARAALVCRVGNRVFPFSLCEERLSDARVFADALASP